MAAQMDHCDAPSGFVMMNVSLKPVAKRLHEAWGKHLWYSVENELFDLQRSKVTNLFPVKLNSAREGIPNHVVSFEHYGVNYFSRWSYVRCKS